MKFKKGEKKPENSGRRKGTPNKATQTLKEAALGALNAGDGAQKFFERLKDKKPEAFSQFLARILPSEIKVDADMRGNVVVEVVEFGRKRDA